MPYGPFLKKKAHRRVTVVRSELSAGAGDLRVDGLGSGADKAGYRLAAIVGGHIGHDFPLPFREKADR